MTPTERLLLEHTNKALAFLESHTGLEAPPLTEAAFLALKAEVAGLQTAEHDLSECRCRLCRRFWADVLACARYARAQEQTR